MTSPGDEKLEAHLNQDEQSMAYVQQIEKEKQQNEEEPEMGEERTEKQARQGDDAPQAVAFAIPPEDVSEASVQKLLGDAIGDTLFSQRAVLKTIMQLKNMQWSEDFEDDLCFFWDSTVNDDVCLFLYKMDFPILAQGLILEHFENERFVEIMIGIVANMLCSEIAFPDSSIPITKEQVLFFVSILHKTDDPLILVQVLRYTNAVLHNKWVEFSDCLSEADVEKLNFFLNNSTNVDLLVTSLKVMSKFCILHAETEANVSKSMIDGSVFASALEAQKTVAEATEYWSEQHRQAMVSTFEILNSLLGESATTSDFRDKIGEYLERFLGEFTIFLNYFCSEYNADPSEQFLYCLNTACDVCVMLRISCESDVVRPLAKLLYIRDNYADLDLTRAVRLIAYFVANYGQVVYDKCKDCVDVMEVFHWIKALIQEKKQQNQVLFDFDFMDEVDSERPIES